MISKQSLLDNTRIATPCPAMWSEMDGDDRMRHCKLCKLNVFDISAMTREEAEKLLRENTGRLCLRLHVRADGRIITKDCPVGKVALRKRLAYIVASGAALIFASLGKAASLKNEGYTPAESDFGVLYANAKERILESGVFGKKLVPPPTRPTPTVTGVTMGVVAIPTPVHKSTKSSAWFAPSTTSSHSTSSTP